jgi:hypothetical protein
MPGSRRRRSNRLRVLNQGEFGAEFPVNTLVPCEAVKVNEEGVLTAIVMEDKDIASTIGPGGTAENRRRNHKRKR